MAKFLRTQDISAQIGEIIRHADNSVVLISPFVKINEELIRHLKDAGRKGVKIKLVYGKEELKPEVKDQLAKLDNITVYFQKTLHAKCYYNEKQMVITSMNLYDFSEVNNLEMGVLINAEGDENVFQEVRKEAESIVNNAGKVKIKDSPIEEIAKDFRSITDSLGLTTQEGHCILCGTSKEYNTKEPFCKKCYPKWRAKHRDPNFPGEYCHKCGEHAKTTRTRSLCSSCYNKK